MLATCPTDVNRQGHLRNRAMPLTYLQIRVPCSQENLLPPLHLVKTLAPPLALDDAGDEVLSCRDFSDAVLTPVADIVLSAAAVGVLHRQVRARWIELLGLPFFPSSSSSCGKYNSIFTIFLILKDSSYLPKLVSAYMMLDLFCLHLILPSQFT